LKLDQTCVRRTTQAFCDSEKNDDRIKEHDRLTSLEGVDVEQKHGSIARAQMFPAIR
jgi:hypothetical protein